VGLRSGGYDPGKLIRNDTNPLTKEQSEWFLNQANLKFWGEAHERAKPGGADGSQWIIEGVKNGEYRIEDRWSPEAGPIHDLGIAMAIGLAGLKIPKEEIY